MFHDIYNIETECGRYQETIPGILLISPNNVMDLIDIMASQAKIIRSCMSQDLQDQTIFTYCTHPYSITFLIRTLVLEGMWFLMYIAPLTDI